MKDKQIIALIVVVILFILTGLIHTLMVYKSGVYCEHEDIIIDKDGHVVFQKDINLMPNCIRNATIIFAKDKEGAKA